MEERNSKFFFQVFLPQEILVHIFSFVDLSTLGHCCRVCKEWNFTLSSPPIDIVWKLIILKNVEKYSQVKVPSSVKTSSFKSWKEQVQFCLKEWFYFKLSDEEIARETNSIQFLVREGSVTLLKQKLNLALLSRLGTKLDLSNLILSALSFKYESPPSKQVNQQVNEMMEYLFSLGATGHTFGKFGITPLHVAVDHDDLSTISILLDHGAQPESKCALTNQTALQAAIYAGKIQATKILLDYEQNRKQKHILYYESENNILSFDPKLFDYVLEKAFSVIIQYHYNFMFHFQKYSLFKNSSKKFMKTY